MDEADPNAVLLYLAPYADPSDAEEICEVVLVSESWTCERHHLPDGGTSDVHHPASHGLSIGWNEATDKRWSERVVILSSEPRVSYD
jgi:hypothetical protein